MRALAQMAELVDALVSGTSAARRGGSSPLLGTSFAGKPTLSRLFCCLFTCAPTTRRPICYTRRACRPRERHVAFPCLPGAQPHRRTRPRHAGRAAHRKRHRTSGKTRHASGHPQRKTPYPRTGGGPPTAAPRFTPCSLGIFRLGQMQTCRYNAATCPDGGIGRRTSFRY